MMTEKELVELSKANRSDFLQEKRSEWKNAATERDRAQIIIELIQLEPTHLFEPWILKQVVAWLMDRRSNIENLRSAFISKGLRDEPTDDQIKTLAKKAILSHTADEIAKKDGIPKERAYRKIVLGSADDNLPDDAEKAVKKRIMDYRAKVRSRKLPYPYFGKDIIEFHDHVELKMDYRMVSYVKNGQQVYQLANWKIYHKK
jgi:hypothetical protein